MSVTRAINAISVYYISTFIISKSDYKPVSCKFITDTVKFKANAVHEKMGESTGDNIVSITTDHWTSNAYHNYQGMTMHWIDDQWKLHSLLVKCFLYEGSSKSEPLLF